MLTLVESDPLVILSDTFIRTRTSSPERTGLVVPNVVVIPFSSFTGFWSACPVEAEVAYGQYSSCYIMIFFRYFFNTQQRVVTITFSFMCTVYMIQCCWPPIVFYMPQIKTCSIGSYRHLTSLAFLQDEPCSL